MRKNKKKYLLSILICCCIQNLHPNPTTIEHWDPSPNFAANGSSILQGSQINHKRKKDMRESNYEKRKKYCDLSLSISVQAACSASGTTEYKRFQSDCSDQNSCILHSGKEYQLGNFRGTPYAMGLFLGNDPAGNNIYDNNEINNEITSLTSASIKKTQLPTNLKTIAQILTGNIDPSTGVARQNDIYDNALMFSPASTIATTPSIFSNLLEEDKTYFGAFTLPLEYKKYSFRAESNIELHENFTVTVQGGISNINHKTSGLESITCGNYNDSASTRNTNSLYYQIRKRTNETNIPDTQAQKIFNEQISNNINQILSECGGINQSVESFNKTGAEDLRIIATFKKNLLLDDLIKDDSKLDEWPEIEITPLFYVAGTIPTGVAKDYDKLLSLPFGNNGHYSFAGGAGISLDFIDSIEASFEIGATYFTPHSEYRPVPNHQLQRVLYPYRTNITTKPGINWHVSATASGNNVLDGVGFWLNYKFIDHLQNCTELCNENNIAENEEKIFYPEMLDKNSAWRSQLIDFGLKFDIKENLAAGFSMQMAISTKNAYNPTSFTASLNFNF